MPASPVRNFFYLLLLGVVLLTLALVVRSGIFASKHFDEPINSAMRASLAQDHPEFSTEESLTIERLYPTAHQLASGVRFLVRDPGQGEASPAAGDTVTVRYKGSLLGGGEFDSSDRHGGAFTFTVGTGQVIKGWDSAILEAKMKKGEKFTVIVPWWLAYGAEGRPPTIPPRTSLVFELELLAF